MGALAKRGGGRGGNGGAVWATEMGSWEGNHPELVSFLSATSYPDGEERTPGTLLFFMEGVSLKACLSDRDQGLVTFVTASTFEGILDGLEDGLREDGLDWRVAKRDTTRKPPRKP